MAERESIRLAIDENPLQSEAMSVDFIDFVDFAANFRSTSSRLLYQQKDS
jgi:hypothetical protein